MKSAGLAAFLSFVIPGLGQLYNGQYGKMLIFFILIFVNTALTFVLIGYLTGFITLIIGIIDAYKSAKRLNQANQVMAY